LCFTSTAINDINRQVLNVLAPTPATANHSTNTDFGVAGGAPGGAAGRLPIAAKGNQRATPFNA
jgi:hypothetical protein